MSRKLRLLDLFCGAGGAAAGYREAGFTVTGVDHKYFSNYAGHTFHQTDAVSFLIQHGRQYDAIHASPPCQAYSKIGHRRHKHPQLIEIVRYWCVKYEKPFIIENVPGAPLQFPTLLCGSMFSLGVRRHRLFECSFPVPQPKCNHKWRLSRPVGVYGSTGGISRRDGIKFATLQEWQYAMRIDWMDAKLLSQAIPPAYTAYLGKYLLKAVNS